MKKILVLLTALVLGSCADKKEEMIERINSIDTSKLFSQKSFECYITNGTAMDVSNKKIHLIENNFSDKEQDKIVKFDKIDFQNSNAVITGNNGSFDVLPFLGENALNFTYANDKTVIIYTIFAEKASNDEFMFAFSRQYTLMGTSQVSQYVGTCR